MTLRRRQRYEPRQGFDRARYFAFPFISTDVYGYPKADARRIATDMVCAVAGRQRPTERVIFCCFELADVTLYEERFCELFLPP
jgi:O-acetyl-ADP-ribose deacetylase (regulator of RNase III)